MKPTQLDINGGGFLGVHADTLKEIIAPYLKDGMVVVEVGSWKGFSTFILASEVKQYNGRVFAVDHWQGNEGTDNFEIAAKNDVFAIFKKNIELLGVDRIVCPLHFDSHTASKTFTDGTTDIVFIDADHRYKHIRQDIEDWLPKVKSGGLICGHDCEGYYSRYPIKDQAEIDCTLENDYPFGRHSGVVRALYDTFKDNYSLKETIWYKRVE